MTAQASNGDKLWVSVLQLNSNDSVRENLEVCARLLSEAKCAGATLAILPENFAYLGADRVTALTIQGAESASLGTKSSSFIEDTVIGWARNYGLTIIAGGFPEPSPEQNRPYNTALVVDQVGTIIGRYRKIHLFDVDLPDGSRFTESSSTLAGSEPLLVTVGGKRIGITVCYDLRFPELYRALVRAGAEVLVVTAAFTRETGRDHWHALLRARAIESQCWVVAAAQWGEHWADGKRSGRASYGHSLIVDPWGTIVRDASDGVAALTQALDFELVRSVRQRMPCLAHQRL